MKIPSKIAPVHLIINLAMALAYFGCGLYFIFSDSAQNLIPDPYPPIFGVVLIIYGIFRSYRGYSKYKEIKNGF